MELVPNSPVPLLYVNPDPEAALKDPSKATVPDASGKVIVLSAVGSVTDIAVSKSFAVDPSNVIFPLFNTIEFAPLPVPAVTVVPKSDVDTKLVIPIKLVT